MSDPSPPLAPLTVVIPTIDAGEMLTRCIAHFAADRPDIEVVVVDNGSRDGSVERAAEAFPRIRVIRNEVNRGYAPACDQGAEAATAPFVLFLNNDALIGADAIDRMLAAATADDDTALWQPVTLGPDGALESTGDLFTWWGILQHRARVPDGESAPVFATVAAALLVRKSVFDSLDGFHESYFAYYEESDLSWRVRLAGWEVRVVTTATVSHLGSETTGRIFPPHAVRYLSFRNRIRTILANASAASLWRLVPLHTLACLGFVALYLVTGRPRSSLSVLQAIWWVLGHRDVLSEQRAAVQSTRRRSDGEVFRPELVTRFGPREVARHLRRAYWFERATERADALVADNRRKS